MATLIELTKAFASYRKHCGHKRKQVKYSEPLKLAVREFVHNNPKIQLQEIAEAIGVTAWTISHWTSSRSTSGFVPVKVVEDAKPAKSGTTQISTGNVSIQLTQDATPEEIERVIKLLIAG